MSETKKKFKIIAIIDKETVLINAGSDDAITEKQAFNIIDEEPVIIKDPETGEVLDTYNRYKQRLYVKEVRPKYSICVSKYETVSVGASLASRVIGSAAIFQAPDLADHHTIGRELNVDKNEVKDILSTYSYAKVHLNDEVIPDK